jgi:hypothetical protein
MSNGKGEKKRRVASVYLTVPAHDLGSQTALLARAVVDDNIAPLNRRVSVSISIWIRAQPAPEHGQE